MKILRQLIKKVVLQELDSRLMKKIMDDEELSTSVLAASDGIKNVKEKAGLEPEDLADFTTELEKLGIMDIVLGKD